MSAIDINEVLSYQLPDKRKRQIGSLGKSDGTDENASPAQQLAKRARFGRTGDDNQDSEGNEAEGDASGREVERLLEAVGSEEVEPLDETSVKKMILNFEKRVLKNQEMRVKFPDDPAKFLESEVELNVAIQEMHALATIPDLYHLLTDLQAVQSLLQLLSHENTDVSVAVVDLLQELTDVEILEESEEGASKLISGLVEGQLIATMVQNMERLDETNKEEADGIHNSLAVVENIVEFKPEVSKLTVEQGLLIWLLRRVRQKGSFDGNKLYASELLAVILQQSEEARKYLGDHDGIDILLQAVASYKRHDPSSFDEMEFMENLFNALCAALMLNENRKKFLDGEGLQLMNLMLRERKQSRASALKVLNHATSGPEGKANSDKFVEILGLRTLFPLLMKTPGKNRRKGHSGEEHEEHVTSVISSLLRNSNSANRARILNKFTENDHMKVDRLVELHFKYAEKVERQERLRLERKTEEKDPDEIYISKLDAGLFTLQTTDLILGDVCANGQSSIAQHALKLLNMKGGSLESVKVILHEYVHNLGEEAGTERDRVLKLIASL